MRKKRKCILFFVLAILAVGPFLTTWVYAEWQIRTLLDKHIAPLSESQENSIVGYIKGDWWYRPPGFGISQARQAELARAAIERMQSMSGYDFLLPIIANEWTWGRHDRYDTLPAEVNAAVRANGPGLDKVLSAVIEWSCDRMKPHIDVESALRADDLAASVACLYFDLAVLNKHRAACLDLLRREDARMSKIALLAKIADQKGGLAWFAGQEDLLHLLCRSEDRQISKYAQEIAQCAGAPKPG